jgi:hypothetical protein
MILRVLSAFPIGPGAEHRPPGAGGDRAHGGVLDASARGRSRRSARAPRRPRPTRQSPYCRTASSSATVGITTSPAPARPKDFSSALSSHSSTTRGRRRRCSNHPSRERRRALWAPGRSTGAPSSDAGKSSRCASARGCDAQTSAPHSPRGWAKARTPGPRGHRACRRGRGPAVWVARSARRRSARVLPHDELQAVVQGHGGGEELVREEPRERVGDPHGEALRPARAAAVQGVLQLAADGEDLLGVALRRAARLGEREAPTLPHEQPLPQAALEGPELPAHRGLRDAKLRGRGGHAAQPRDGPEIIEVVVVQPVHVSGRPARRR